MGLVSNSEFSEILKKRFYDNQPVPHVDVSYLKNHVYLKKYSDDNGHVKYRLIYMPSVKEGGIEYGIDLQNRRERDSLVKAVTRGYDPENPFLSEDDISCYLHDVKFDSSLVRAKSRIFDLAFCNEWEFFFTGTLSGDKVRDRSDLPMLHKKLTQFIKDFNKNHGKKIKFLIVPELHSDGVNWHFHGFLMGFGGDYSNFHKFTFWDAPTCKIKDEIVKGFEVYSWVQYEKSFGWNTVEPIKNHECVAKYCTKYITKDVLSNVSDVGAHVYYRSRGLREPELIKDGQVSMSFVNAICWDSENEFCKVCEVMPDDVEKICSFIESTVDVKKGRVNL